MKETFQGISATTTPEDVKFWASRSKKYDNLEWAIRSEYLKLFVEAGQFQKSDRVLDVGTGTGIIAHAVAPLVRSVCAIDICPDMLKKARAQKLANTQYEIGDAYSIPYDENTFDKVTARMVFHHLIVNMKSAMDECYRVIKDGGMMILSEGVPPSQHVVPFYTEMFKLKEDRITFLETGLEQLLVTAGFKDIKKIIHFSRRSSIRNWLQNSNLPRATQEQIFQMHLNLDEQGKRDYNMVVKDNDCFIDMKFVILTGIKMGPRSSEIL